MADFIDSRAELGSEEDSDVGSGNEAPINRRRDRNNDDMIDSSEEEDSDDEEEARRIRENFIVDDDGEEEEEEVEDEEARRERRRKRRREEREAEQALDDEDLDLIGVERPHRDDDTGGPKLKRIKRGHRDRPNQLEISDDEFETGEVGGRDEFADFIEDDFPSDDEDDLRERMEVGRPGQPFSIARLTSGMDERAMEDYFKVFGDGTEYEWALQLEEEEKAAMEEAKPLELKDIFEPAQLVEKLMTDEDDRIRVTDIPERFQLAWSKIKRTERTEEEEDRLIEEEAQWISSLMLPKMKFSSYFNAPFEAAIVDVLKFFNKDFLEVPFIFQHRRDFIIHETRVNQDGPPDAERMLTQSDLWEVFEHDLKFKSMVEKRDALRRQYDELKTDLGISDTILDEMLPRALSPEDVQDLHDYLHFRYAGELKEAQLRNGNGEETRKKARKLPGGHAQTWESIRTSKTYDFVRAIGISSDDFARNVLGVDARVFTEDAGESPEDTADGLVNDIDRTSTSVVKTAKSMFVEELSSNPRMRQFIRKSFYEDGVIDCIRTDRGAIEITEDHRYYEFKYLRNIDIPSVARKPESFLRMLQAEKEGLIEVKLRMASAANMRSKLHSFIEINSYSEIGRLWNSLRREWVNAALEKLEGIISGGVKETLKTECENSIARNCRDRYSEKLDQAPYKPQSYQEGEIASVMAISNGNGQFRDAIVWIMMDEEGKLKRNGKWVEIRSRKEDNKQVPQGADNASFLREVSKMEPDVIAVSGFTPEAKRLQKELQDILDQAEKDFLEEVEREKRPGDSEDEDGPKFHKPEVVLVQDEAARLYYNTDRAIVQFPHLPPIGRYCVALARYLQGPLLEYAALGPAITSIKFDPNQDLVPLEKLQRYLETAIVDIVNLVGVDMEDAMRNGYISNLLQYVCGLGPRKANRLLSTINANGGIVTSRAELAVGSEDGKVAQALGPVVWQNCASFLYLRYDESENTSDPLDGTRIHPEDYSLAKKMAADALRLDEEDIQYERRSGQMSAEVRRLLDNHQEEQLLDLHLDSYADNLEKELGQKKRATLELIRAELGNSYEELRRPFTKMEPDEIFTMLTGETKESLADGMIVPVKIKRVNREHIEVRLDCGIDGGINSADYGQLVEQNGGDARAVYHPGQTVPAKLLFLNRKTMIAQLSLREDMLRRQYVKPTDRLDSEWDAVQEREDERKAQKEKESKSGRPHRVIKHPLFKAFNSMQAEEYLGSRPPGDVVIRTSSRGLDHLAITWKVADRVFQHIDVLELDKENEYAVGKTLKIGGKYTYSDLDDLIVNHIEAMAKKVVEMTNDERYQKGSRADTEQWLNTYTEANPKRSMYAFCINPKYPGYFHLCFKQGEAAPLGCWSVKVVPNGFELKNLQYPNMMALKNGFKILMGKQDQNGGMTSRR